MTPLSRLLWHLYHHARLRALFDLALAKLEGTVHRFRSGGPSVELTRVKEILPREETPLVVAVLVGIALLIWLKG